MSDPRRVLFIQTAFIGDAVLMSSAIRSWKQKHPETICEVVVRKGNESLYMTHPEVDEVWVWDKSKKGRNRRLVALGWQLRKRKYDVVFNIHRHVSSGLLTWLTGAPQRVGYASNPLAWAFTHRVSHNIGDGRHEVERLGDLLNACDGKRVHDDWLIPTLYPSAHDQQLVENIIVDSGWAGSSYVVLAPSSQWHTKQWPEENWRLLAAALDRAQVPLALIGAPTDLDLLNRCQSSTPSARVLANLTLLQAYELVRRAGALVTHDSAPLHWASGSNVPTVALFCSTVPAFGFGPLADARCVIETEKTLNCRPCGLHGHAVCPQGHFACADIPVQRVQAAVLSLLGSQQPQSS
ncbi:MAG: glycosyltransferase family 9 protein [Flavobacteriales bacterium]